MKPYRILMADDHVLFREAIRKAIESTEGLVVVGGVGDGLELMEFLKDSRPELIILDVTMPNLSGLEAAREIKKLYPEVKILILSMHKSVGCLKGALLAGVNGYLLKEDAFQDLISAIKTIQSGKAYFSPRLAGQMSYIVSHQDTDDRLSPQENKILSLIAEYLTNEEICDRLFISMSTLENHLYRIKNKLNIKTRPHLIKYGREIKGAD